MERRDFIGLLSVGGGAITAFPSLCAFGNPQRPDLLGDELKADMVVVGGGLGGFAAAMAGLKNGLSVMMTEETDWIGGQITQQGVPSDEHQWIETTGATQMYRAYRNAVRDHYRKYYPMTEEARNNPLLNPGNSTGARRLGHEPKVSLEFYQT